MFSVQFFGERLAVFTLKTDYPFKTDNCRYILSTNAAIVPGNMAAAMHHPMKMAANDSDTHSDDNLTFYLFTQSRRRKRRQRSISVYLRYGLPAVCTILQYRSVKVVYHSRKCMKMLGFLLKGRGGGGYLKTLLSPKVLMEGLGMVCMYIVTWHGVT